MATANKNWTSIRFEDLELTLEAIPPDDGGGWRAWVREFGKHGLMGDGETPEEAVTMLKAELPGFLRQMQKAGAPVPDLARPDQWSGRILVRVPSSLHRDLVRAATREGTSLNTYVVSLLSRGVSWVRTEAPCSRSRPVEKYSPQPEGWAEAYPLAA